MFTRIIEYTWGMPFNSGYVSRTSMELTPGALIPARGWTLSIPTGATSDGQNYFGMEDLSIDTTTDFRGDTDQLVPTSFGQAGWGLTGQVWSATALDPTSGNRVPKNSAENIHVEYTTLNLDPVTEGAREVLASYDKHIESTVHTNPNDSDIDPVLVHVEKSTDCTDGAGNGTLICSPFIYGNIAYNNTHVVSSTGLGLHSISESYAWIRVRTKLRFRMRQVTREQFFQTRNKVQGVIFDA